MEFFAATGKLKKVFLQPEMFDVYTMGDTAHIDTILKLLPHTHNCGMTTLKFIHSFYVRKCRVV